MHDSIKKVIENINFFTYLFKNLKINKPPLLKTFLFNF